MTAPESQLETPAKGQPHRARTLFATLSITVIVVATATTAICAIRIAHEQHEQTRLAQQTACYQRSTALTALWTSVDPVGPDSPKGLRDQIANGTIPAYTACAPLDQSPDVPTPATTNATTTTTANTCFGDDIPKGCTP